MIPEEEGDPTPRLDHRGDEAALRAQVLATEHWSLLATRSMTWSEIFSRTGTFLTVLSAAAVALSLTAQAAGFGPSFRAFALVVLPIALLVGLGTYVRLVEADIEDAWLIVGMNRMRHGYLELAPDLEAYFVTSPDDDIPGVLQTYSFGRKLGIIHLLSGSPFIVGVIDAVVSGVLGSLAFQIISQSGPGHIFVGFAVAATTSVLLGLLWYRRIHRARRGHRARFPSRLTANGG
jgi:membrane protein implicated in regulation of membrane protease activity